MSKPLDSRKNKTVEFSINNGFSQIVSKKATITIVFWSKNPKNIQKPEQQKNADIDAIYPWLRIKNDTCFHS